MLLASLASFGSIGLIGSGLLGLAAKFPAKHVSTLYFFIDVNFWKLSVHLKTLHYVQNGVLQSFRTLSVFQKYLTRNTKIKNKKEKMHSFSLVLVFLCSPSSPLSSKNHHFSCKAVTGC